MIYVMNDYELLYLIQGEVCDLALNFMYQKYQKLIWKHIHNLHLDKKEYDDFHQEGLLMLLKSIQTFDEKYNKSFTRYFELILKRHYYGLLRTIPTYKLYETTDFIKETVYLEEEKTYLQFESVIEQEIHHRYFIFNESVSAISKATGYESKQIYNAIYRIKEKYKIVI